MGVVYSSTIDEGRFMVTVSAEEVGPATMVVREGDVVLLCETVPMSSGGPYGPDNDDVGVWKLRALEVIDYHLIEGGELVPSSPQPVSGPRRRKRA